MKKKKLKKELVALRDLLDKFLVEIQDKDYAASEAYCRLRDLYANHKKRYDDE